MVLRSLLKNLTALVMCRNDLELLLDERKKKWGKRKLSGGNTIGGRGRLTNQRIDKLQNCDRLSIMPQCNETEINTP